MSSILHMIVKFKFALMIVTGVLSLFGVLFIMSFFSPGGNFLTGYVPFLDSTTNSMSFEETNDIIMTIIDLRNASINDDKIAVSLLHQELQSKLLQSNCKFELAQVSDCVIDFCDDDVYIDLIDSVARDNFRGRNVAIHALTETYKLQTSKDSSIRSASIARTNSLLKSWSPEMNSMWTEFTKCNGCSKSSEMYFDMVEEMNK